MYTKYTPFDKVRSQLIVKIQDTYLPEEQQIAGVVTNVNSLDFTGGST